MREKPAALRDWEPYNELWDPMAFGMTEGRFQLATETYGDGDSFRWIAGGGEVEYKITRISRGYSQDDEIACSKWELQEFNALGEIIRTVTVDVTTFELRDETGELLAMDGINELDKVLVDLDDEMKSRNPTTAFLLRPLGHTGLVQPMFNRGFNDEIGVNEQEIEESGFDDE